MSSQESSVPQPRCQPHRRSAQSTGLVPMAIVRFVSMMALLLCCNGCGLFGGSGQLKQLQAENDKLVSEYRAQRDKVAKLQETNTALEQRVAEAEKLLARSGYNLPSSRLSQVPGRSPSSSTSGMNSAAPPYVPPPADSSASEGDLKWRPMRRQ